MFEHIIVPLDGSPLAEQALPVAARIAHTTGGAIHILQVINLVVDYGGGLSSAACMTEQSVEMEMTQSKDYLKTVVAHSELVGIHVTTEVIFGIPAQSILTASEAGKADLIVLCSHGRTGFTRWALGSVAHTLAHESMVPILVLRDGESTPLLSSRSADRQLCALVPLDGSGPSEAALAPAAYLIAALASPAQGALYLAQVVKPFPVTTEEGFIGAVDEESALRCARTYLEQVTERVQATTQDLTLSVASSVELEKDVSCALINLAEHRGEKNNKDRSVDGCDLIAISTHGRGGLERWVMGSVTERLLNTTTLPMLIVRPAKQKV